MFYICVLNIFKSRLDETEDIIFVFVSAKSQVYSMHVRLCILYNSLFQSSKLIDGR